MCRQVRVKLAPKRAEGKALGRCDVLEEDWLEFGLAPPMPEVGHDTAVRVPTD